MTTTELFLLAMLIIFSLPWLVWRLLRTDGYAPLVVVQIVGGVLLGPGVAGAMFPDAHAALFSPQVITALNGIAWWGVMLFVFIAGVELDLKAAWGSRRETGVTAAAALVVPLLFGMAAAAILLRDSGWIGANGTRMQVIAGIGMACAVTALPILILFMEKLAILRAPLGQRILRYASLDDLAIWAVLALILLDTERLARQGIFLIAFAVAAFLVRRAMPRLTEADRWPLALMWLLAIGLIADWAGLHYMVGAFLAGAVLDSHWFDQKRMDDFRAQVLFVLMPVFFLSTGLRTNWDMGGVAVIGAAALLLGASVAGKLAGVHLAARLLGWPRGEASLIGWLLQTKALIMIIFAQVLLDRGIITSDAFTALLLMAVGSTMLTIPVVRRLRARGQP